MNPHYSRTGANSQAGGGARSAPEGVEKVQGVAPDRAFPGVRMRRGGHLHLSRFGKTHAVEREGSPEHVAGEAFQAVGRVV